VNEKSDAQQIPMTEYNARNAYGNIAVDLALISYGATEFDWDALFEHELPRILNIAKRIADYQRRIRKIITLQSP
jgi:hypothetical protein